MTSASIHDDFLNSKRDGTSVAIEEIVDLHMRMTSSYYLNNYNFSQKCIEKRFIITYIIL